MIGAALAFEGLRGLFALLSPHLDDAADRARRAALAEAQAAPRRRPALRLALVALIVLALVGGGVFWLRSPESVPPAAFAGRCNGSAALCDRPVDQVVFPGAHNAMSAADFPGWLMPNQEVGMAGQLRHGIRALLFDVHNGIPVAGRVKTVLEDEPGSRAKFEQAVGAEGIAAAMRIRDRLVGPPEGPKAPYLCHGFCELGARPLADALREVRDFLVEHPGEVLLVVIEDYVPPDDVAKAFDESGLSAYVYRGKPGPPWPTLRQLIESDQRVVVSAENDNGGGSVRLVRQGLRRDAGDALPLREGGGAVLPAEPRRRRQVAVPDEPLDRHHADAEALERRDPQPEGLRDRARAAVREGARPLPEHPRRRLRADGRRGRGRCRAQCSRRGASLTRGALAARPR